MGTALTEAHLRELGRLTKRLFLCFDADAAGEDATLRGMELAASRDSTSASWLCRPARIRRMPRRGSKSGLPGAESYLHYRVRLELERSSDRQEAWIRAREILSQAEDSPEWQKTLRLLADRLDLPKETLSGISPARGPRASAHPQNDDQPQRLLDAGERLERDALAAVMAHRELLDGLKELSAEHFDTEAHRRIRAELIGADGPAPDAALLATGRARRTCRAGGDHAAHGHRVAPAPA